MPDVNSGDLLAGMSPEQWAALGGPGMPWQGGENILSGLAKMAMAPGQALQSTTPITTEEMIKPATDLALGMVGTPGGVGGVGSGARLRAPSLGDTAAETLAAPKVLKFPDAPGAVPAVAERYPTTAPPVEAVDPSGKTYLAKTLSDEALQVQKARQVAQQDITAGNYQPYFDPAKRADVDPYYHPAVESTLDIRKVKPETQAKYDQMAQDPAAMDRLGSAFERGLKQEQGAGNWYFVKQLEDQFVKEYGPDAGRQLFKERFPDAMAATTGGADPTSNLMMAHYGNYLKARGDALPERGYEYPFPIGGRYAASNMDQYNKMIMQGRGIAPDVNPKRYNFASNFLGNPSGATIDEQMMGILKPGMQMPPTGAYGHFEQPVVDLAARKGVDPRYLQEVAWAGQKDATTKGGYTAQPMIANINEAIERTHRITGMPRDEIVRRGLVRAEIPLYGGLGGALGAATLQDQPQQ